MIPIAKNILVVDEQGNEYEATWPRRARGLVKSGRARFLSENKICLACPPRIDTEDNEMTDVIMTDIQIGKNAVEAFKSAFAAENGDQRESEISTEDLQNDGRSEGCETEDLSGSTSETAGGEIPQSASPENGRTAYHTSTAGTRRAAENQTAPGKGIDMAYLFDQIGTIQNQTDYLLAAIDGLAAMSDGDSGGMNAPGNIMGKAKAEAIGDVVRCRETTNQQLLNFYMAVYNDLKSQA